MNRILINGLFLLVGLLISLRGYGADDIWFEAGFDEGDEDTSVSGFWACDNDGAGEFVDDQLRLNFASSEEPMSFMAEEGFDAAAEELVLTVDSVITCYGYDRLPAPPKKADGIKTAVVAMDDGDYFVLGYDVEGETNRWFDTGVKARFGEDVNVRVTFMTVDSQSVASYEFDGVATDPIPIFCSQVAQVEFVGSGVVGKLSATRASAPKPVDVVVPKYYGIEVLLLPQDVQAYPGATITLWFISDYGFVSRDSAQYLVMNDGSLVFADTGEPPCLVTPEVMIGETVYRSLREALKVAKAGDEVQLLRDVIISEDLVYTTGRIVFNGFEIDPVLGTDARVIFAAGSNPDFKNGDARAMSINAEIVTMTDLDFGTKSDLYSWRLTLGTPDVRVVSALPLHDVRCGLDGYELVSSHEDGAYEYTLKNVAAQYPDFIENESDEVKSRYDQWSSAYNVDVGSAAREPYLLDCDPSAVSEAKEKFMIISIRREGADWVVLVTGGKGEGDRYGNGYVHIKSVKDSLQVPSTADRDFFRAELLIAPVNADEK